MRDVEKYVDNLFKGYKKTEEIEELHREILTNLEARIKDNMDRGLDYNSAYDEAIKNIKNVDIFIDGNKEIYINRFKKKLSEIAMIYILLGWIITIPLRLNITLIKINTIFTIGAIFIGLIYLYMSSKKDDEYLDSTTVVNSNKLKRLKKYIWIIWSIFIILQTFSHIGIYFGSNIWFSTQIRIDGPYEFAILTVNFILPLLSIIIPLFISKAYNLLNKYEVN